MFALKRYEALCSFDIFMCIIFSHFVVVKYAFSTFCQTDVAKVHVASVAL